jgi:hypothetical protein
LRDVEEKRTCFANVELLLDEQADEGEDTDVSSKDGIRQMDSIDLLVSKPATLGSYAKGMESFSPEFSVSCHSKSRQEGGDSGDVVGVFTLLDEFDISGKPQNWIDGRVDWPQIKGVLNSRSEKQRNYPIPLFIDELEGRDVVREDVVTRPMVADVIGVGWRTCRKFYNPQLGISASLSIPHYRIGPFPSCRQSI